MKRKILVIASILFVSALVFTLTNLNPHLVPQKKSYPEGTQTITAIWKGVTLFGHSTGYPFTNVEEVLAHPAVNVILSECEESPSVCTNNRKELL